MVTEAPTSPRGTHTLEQKLELVERILRGRLTLQEACVKYGVSAPELKEWVRLYRREARRVLDDRVRQALSTQGVDVEDLEPAEFSGSVETLAVAEVIQALALGRKDAEVLIEHDGEKSRIWCADGEIVDAECGRLLGAPAVYRLLTVQRGRVHADCAPVRRPRTITVSTQALLMEAARRSDECRELRGRLGNMDAVFITSSAAMAPDALASPTEFAMLRLLDGQRSLDEVVRDSSLPDLETLAHLLELRTRGMMVPGPTPPADRAKKLSSRPSRRPSQQLPELGGRNVAVRRTGPVEASELSFVPLAASLGVRPESRWSRRRVWGLAAVGATSLGLAVALRYSEHIRAAAERAARIAGRSGTTAAAGSRAPSAAARATAAVASGGPAAVTLAAPDPVASPAPVASGKAPLPPSAADEAPARAGAVPVSGGLPESVAAAGAPVAGSCPEGTAMLSRPAERDTGAQTYCLDRFEVTAAAYAQCVDKSGCRAVRRETVFPGVAQGAAARRRTRAAFLAQCNADAPGRGQHPMNCLSYTEAEAYCSWRGGRLPSDAEWEFAVEGVRARPFPWGSDEPRPGLVNACGSECKTWHGSLGLHGAFDGQMYDGGDGYAGTAPVGSFPGGSTPEGIHDLVGNVAEWTTGSAAVFDDAGFDGEAGALVSHVVRGGAFTSSHAALNPPALRLYLGARERDRAVGFRCAYSLK
jgi:formylglycine-generating enzyme required for sulfatase activity/transposase-like protein